MPANNSLMGGGVNGAIETVKNYLATHILPTEIIFACFDGENSAYIAGF